jgi:hypothetical protein
MVVNYNLHFIPRRWKNENKDPAGTSPYVDCHQAAKVPTGKTTHEVTSLPQYNGPTIPSIGPSSPKPNASIAHGAKITNIPNATTATNGHQQIKEILAMG